MTHRTVVSKAEGDEIAALVLMLVERIRDRQRIPQPPGPEPHAPPRSRPRCVRRPTRQRTA